MFENSLLRMAIFGLKSHSYQNEIDFEKNLVPFMGEQNFLLFLAPKMVNP